MIKNLFQRLKYLWTALTKTGNDFIDVFTKPKNDVLILLRDKDTNEVVKTIKGRNIVTGYINGTLIGISGRDFLRRVVLQNSGGLASETVSGRYIAKMRLGSGTDQESINDIALDNDLYGTDTNAEKVIGTTVNTDVSLSSSDPDVTFVCTWPAGHLNGHAISEVGLYSNASTADFIARKTFPTFTKTSNFTVEIQWTLRF
jgi:hypothetical protein